ncbi:MAG: nucleotide exchange factor GrpE [Candidatus Harrisonbacteria bacterium]|nr:nucleotide exchange factor GrpE [Candidatus Harrisonbacteria bacterium]
MSEDNKDEKLNSEEEVGEEKKPKDGEEVDKLKAERDEYLNGWKRAKADLINYQKDEGKRFEEMAEYVTGAMVRDLIPVLDSFELGIAALEKNGPVDKGVYIIKTQLEEVLKKKGLEKIKVSPGDPFDTMKHESIGEVEGKGVSGQVAEEIESGYMLNGKVVRPARVKLTK